MSVTAPAALWLDVQVPATVKLVWVARRLYESESPSLLSARTGLARTTVSKALTLLQKSPREPARGREPAIELPAELVADRRLSAPAKVLYGLLQLTPEFDPPAGQFTWVDLSRRFGADVKSLKRAAQELANSGWLRLWKAEHQRLRTRFALVDPVAEREEAERNLAQVRLERAPFKGEALMREFLSLLVDSREFSDDDAPGFLVNPLTGQRMQLDRHYQGHKVAFEYNGPQHYGETERFSKETAQQQRMRDLIKYGICAERGIRVVVIHARDLSLKGILQKLPEQLPRRTLTGHDSLRTHLEKVARKYRGAAANN